MRTVAQGRVIAENFHEQEQARVRWTAGCRRGLRAPRRPAQATPLQWSITIGAPMVIYPAPVVVQHAPVVVGRPTAAVAYQEPTRWDHDGDRIPNRHDRLYNPRWDVDGDGVPNRRDRHDDRYRRGR